MAILDVNKGSTEPKTETIEKSPTMTFPHEESRKIFIRRKSSKSLPKGSDPKETIQKIGSSLAGKDSLRGLTAKEEDKLLPKIIGIRKESERFEENVKAYWDNISAIVPPGDGLELEIGLRWNSQAEYDADQKAVVKDYFGTKVPIELEGTPINVGDYILWRYCLLYSDVANNIENINKSTKIRFFIYSREREVLDQKSKMRSRQQANQLFYQNMSDRSWVDAVLRVIITSDPARKLSIHDLNKMEPDEKDIVLEEYLIKEPDKFLSIGKDSDLTLRAFIEDCVANNILNRVPNTQTIMRDTEVIGNSMKEAVGFLKHPANERVLNEIRAALNLTPSAKK